MKRGIGIKAPFIVAIILVLIWITLIYFIISPTSESITQIPSRINQPSFSPIQPPNPTDCSDSNIKAVWDSIFLQSSSGITIKTNESYNFCRGSRNQALALIPKKFT